LDIDSIGDYNVDSLIFQMKKINLYDILFWIFFIIAVITILWYIFGDSPTIEQALLVFIIAVLFKMQSIVSTNGLEIKILKSSFIRLANDFKEHIKHK
jgi:hypothetical protein